MILMKQICPAAVDWLTDPKRNPKHWCRAHFNTFLKCDVLLNNLCESFNAAILPARLKPVITCFEEIRVRMMKRIAVRKDKMSKVLDPICPKPRVILEKNKVKAVTDCIPQGTGSTKIEVQSIGDSKYVVDLAKRMCACRRWDLTGIPCKHAIAAINLMRQKPEEFVDACYLTKTYMATYSNTIQPVNGMSLWIPSEEPAILPPKYNRQPGRPKTKRAKNASELENDGPKLGRVQRSLKCSRCGVLGHNITTCHRHLPPKEKALNTSKKRKLNNGSTSSSASASASKANGTKDPPKTKNELRAKAAKRAEDAKEKRAAQRVATRATSKPAPRGRPPKAATNSGKAASSKAKDSAPQASQASSTTSVRIRDNAKNGRK